MDRYLRKLHKIKFKSRDPADYDAFISQATAFLQNTKIIRDKWVESAQKALHTKKNALVRGLLYKIIAHYDSCQEESWSCERPRIISADVVLKDVHKQNIIGPVLYYLSKNPISGTDEEIGKTAILEPGYLSNDLYLYLDNAEYARLLLFGLDSSDYVFKQLMVSANANVAYNLGYFFSFLGSSNKILAFAAFEAFSAVFQRAASGNLINGLQLISDRSSASARHYVSAELNSACSRLTRLTVAYDEELLLPTVFIDIHLSKTNIESWQNFCKYAFNFIEEKNELISAIRHNSKNGVLSIVSKYFSYAEENLDIPSENSLCYNKALAQNTPCHTNGTDFDYLFKKSASRNVCTCPEL
ncbi:hypothetical protein ENBRE01_1289 [Enteropsectra breve]|nr:hypothetical protein ENBRE01_1289 [Enteropsectra breve]